MVKQEEKNMEKNHQTDEAVIDLEQEENVIESKKDEETIAKEKELEDKILRLQAEFANYKKRIENERNELADHIKADLLQKLLPVIDDFDRLIEHIDDDESREHVIEGVKLVHKKLKTTLAEQGLEEVPALGRKFDPNYHEAVMIANHEHAEEDEILEEWQKGYLFRNRLLRPARVKVNKK